MTKKDVIDYLQKNSRQKAKEIAKQFFVDKSAVNSLLYGDSDTFVCDDLYRWSLKEKKSITIPFQEFTWVSSEEFELSLSSVGCLFSSQCENIEFIVTNECKILLDAASRLLALCNQLVKRNKKITINFLHCDSTRTYFDRIGFMQQLDSNVIVIPERPTVSAATIYKGNSDAVVEFGSIYIDNPDSTIPKRLKNQFVLHAGDIYSDAAFTIFSELFGNVCEHSNTPIPGFAALQKYKKPRPHIQTVVSDSGDGIIGTLRPILSKHYPNLAKKYCFDDPMSEVLLLKEVLEQGRITQTGCSKSTGRGLGLKRSQEYAVQYNADISVRQETFELKLCYRSGNLISWRHSISMPKIMGTHVCFDFILDQKSTSR